ncbi:hypothetical protein BSYN_04150 [Bacteroides sedimenti]|uniref:Uncharacterized protein n=1 Tax=Bacteroides sedimenti TaxID=2136147 RepID=A0ABM8I7S3_9BACE
MAREKKEKDESNQQKECWEKIEIPGKLADLHIHYVDPVDKQIRNNEQCEQCEEDFLYHNSYCVLKSFLTEQERL